MGTELVQYTVSDLERMSAAIAKSQLFGVQNSDQAMALMLISQAEGRHPALAARDYDIIQKKPAKKAEAMQRDFLASGGKVEWHQLDDTAAIATFSHPSGGSVKIDWTMARAKQAGLGGKEMWTKYPRQMLRSRCISEGVRTVFPAATSGMYVPEEVKDFAPEPEMKNITPKADVIKPEAPKVPVHPETGEVGPHKIVVAEPADWKAFGVGFAAAVKAASSLEELTDWQTFNQESLEKMFVEAPKLHTRLVTLGKEKFDLLHAAPSDELPANLQGEAA